MPDGNTTVIIQGKKRFEISEMVSETPYMVAKIQDVPEVSSFKHHGVPSYYRVD